MHRRSHTHSELTNDNMENKRTSGEENNLFKKIKTTLFAAVLLNAYIHTYILLLSLTHRTRLNDMRLSFKQADVKHIHTYWHMMQTWVQKYNRGTREIMHHTIQVKKMHTVYGSFQPNQFSSSVNWGETNF